MPFDVGDLVAITDIPLACLRSDVVNTIVLYQAEPLPPLRDLSTVDESARKTMLAARRQKTADVV